MMGTSCLAMFMPPRSPGLIASSTRWFENAVRRPAGVLEDEQAILTMRSLSTTAVSVPRSNCAKACL